MRVAACTVVTIIVGLVTTWLFDWWERVTYAYLDD
jgi:hypothetical protein